MIQPQVAAVTIRNRAIFGIRAYTVAAILGSVGLSWLFAWLAEDYFSGKPVATVVPAVPNLAAPVQQPPKVIQKTVHKTGYPPGSVGSNPRPPTSRPGPAPPAAPRACRSTPSKPC